MVWKMIARPQRYPSGTHAAVHADAAPQQETMASDSALADVDGWPGLRQDAAPHRNEEMMPT